MPQKDGAILAEKFAIILSVVAATVIMLFLVFLASGL